ncbi:MAG: DMT family transporter [Sandaracinus sp.]
MSESARPPASRIHAALLAVQLAFASLSVAGRILVRELDPLALALVRLAGAGLVLVVLDRARPTKAAPMTWRDRAGIAACATLGIFGNQALFLTGLRFTTATHATLLVATIPVFTALVGLALYTLAPKLGVGEPARGGVLAGIGIAISGVIALVLPDALASATGEDAWWGDLLVTANSFVYAIYLVLIRRYATRHGSLPVVAWGFTWGALLALPLGGPALLEDAPALGPRAWALVLYVVLVATVFTYLANAWALRFATPSLVATYIFVQPIVASLLAWWVLGEVPTARLGVAAVLVAAGVALVVRSQERQDGARPTRTGDRVKVPAGAE